MTVKNHHNSAPAGRFGTFTGVFTPNILTILGISIPFSMTDNVYLFLMITLLGCLAGFIFFNWHPSKMYMGDTGSQYLGVLLAALGINYLWNPITTDEFAISRQILIPIISFIIPIIDTTTVTIKRLRRGNSPFVGGRDHTTHHLSYMGLSEKQVAAVVALISIISSAIVIYVINSITKWTHLYTIAFIAYFLIIFVILFIIANKNIPEEDDK